MSIKLIACDLDGTLLDSTGQISEGNLRAIYAAAEKGINVTICTGRHTRNTREFVAALKIKTPIAVFNGLQVIDAASENIMLCNTLDKGEFRQLLAEFRKTGLPYCIQNDEYGITPQEEEIYRSWQASGRFIDRLIADDEWFSGAKPVAALKLLCNSQQRAQLIQQLYEKYRAKYVFEETSTGINATSGRANKGNALGFIAAGCGVSLQETMAIGDWHNDLEFVRVAGTGVAMGNACEELKALANFVTGTNDEDGVAQAIWKYCPECRGKARSE